MRNSINLKLFSLFIIKSLIENKDLFFFFIIKSSLNSKLNILYEEIEYLYAKTWINKIFNNIKRNARIKLNIR